MAVMKKKTRRKLSKQLNKLIKLHGAEMALALVTGIVSALSAERSNKSGKKQKNGKTPKAEKADTSAGGKPPKVERGGKSQRARGRS